MELPDDPHTEDDRREATTATMRIIIRSIRHSTHRSRALELCARSARRLEPSPPTRAQVRRTRVLSRRWFTAARLFTPHVGSRPACNASGAGPLTPRYSPPRPTKQPSHRRAPPPEPNQAPPHHLPSSSSSRLLPRGPQHAQAHSTPSPLRRPPRSLRKRERFSGSRRLHRR